MPNDFPNIILDHEIQISIYCNVVTLYTGLTIDMSIYSDGMRAYVYEIKSITKISGKIIIEIGYSNENGWLRDIYRIS